MILDLTRSHCTSHEIPGFWALLLETSETDEHLFFPLSIYYIWSSCLQMKIFWLLQPKSNVHLSPPQDLDTRPKFQLLGNWVREWNTNIRMIAVMQKHDEFIAFQSLCTHTEIEGEGEGDTESLHFSSLLPACGFFSQTLQTSSSFSPVAW